VPFDYRNLFVPMAATADLSPGVRKALAELREKPQNADVQLVRLRAPAFAHRMLTTGFDSKDGFSKSGSGFPL